MDVDTRPHPLTLELIAELDGLATGILDAIAALAERPVNMERLGAASQQIEDHRDVFRAMIEQKG